MNDCARCQYPIPAGQETWVRQRNAKQRVALCKNCVTELKQKRQQKQSTTKAPTAPPPAAAPADVPDWLKPIPESQPGNVQPVAKLQDVSAQPQPTTAKTSNPITLEGVLILLSLSILAAPLVGALVGFISQWLYLIILFPIGIGIVSGLIVNVGVHWGKLRSVAVTLFLGMLFGFVVYGSYRYTEYYFLRKDAISIISEEMVLEIGEADPDVAAFILDEILYEETGSTGFWGMVKIEAAEGMSISRARSPGNSLNIGSTLTWIYWFIELAVFVGLPGMAAVGQAGKPFCEFHDRWYGKEESVGGILPAESENIVSLIKSRNFEQISQLLKSDIPVPGFGLFLERCPDCQESQPHLTLKVFKKNSKGKTVDRVVLESYIPVEDGIALQNNYALIETATD